MRPRQLPLLVAVLAAIPLASGCGTESVDPADIAAAAEATRAKDTAQMEISLRLKGAGLPKEVAVDATGVTSLTKPEMDVRFDFGKLAKSFGAPKGDYRMRLRILGHMLYAQPPKVEGLKIPGGASWVALDLATLAKSLGVEALAELVKMDPASELEMIKRTGKLETAGEEELDGIPTTKYEGTLTFREMIDALPASKREKVRKALETLDRKTGEDSGNDQPMDLALWVDEHSLVRQMTFHTKFPAQAGMPATGAEMTYRLKKFGVKLDRTPPAAGETWDATAALQKLLPKGVAG